MKMTSKAFAKKLFGVKYERLSWTFLIDIIIFWGLYIVGFQVQIAPSVRILMLSSFTAGVMWQALSSRDTIVEMQHMLMLPFCRQEFVFSYVTMLGAYTIVTKTGLLLAVLLAVSVWKPIEIVGSIICIIHAVLMTSAVYSLRKYWYASGFWTGVIVGAILLLGSRIWLSLLLFVNGMFSVLFLWKVDGYGFYQQGKKKSHVLKQRKTASLWRYFFRYLGCHKNYLLNIVVIWCVALVLPYFLGEMADLSAILVGFAILSLNTPICILLSCDHDLEQAVRFLFHIACLSFFAIWQQMYCSFAAGRYKMVVLLF